MWRDKVMAAVCALSFSHLLSRACGWWVLDLLPRILTLETLTRHARTHARRSAGSCTFLKLTYTKAMNSQIYGVAIDVGDADCPTFSFVF
jgi:hypothetical protein